MDRIGSRLRTVDTPSSCSSQITPKNIESSPCSTGDYGLSCEWWMAHYTSTLLQAQHLTLSLSLSSLSVYRSKHSLWIMMPQVLDIKGQIAHWSDFAKKHTGLPWREMWSSTVESVPHANKPSHQHHNVFLSQTMENGCGGCSWGQQNPLGTIDICWSARLLHQMGRCSSSARSDG